MSKEGRWVDREALKTRPRIPGRKRVFSLPQTPQNDLSTSWGLGLLAEGQKHRENGAEKMSKKLTLVARKMKERGHATHLSSTGYRACPPLPNIPNESNRRIYSWGWGLLAAGPKSRKMGRKNVWIMGRLVPVLLTAWLLSIQWSFWRGAEWRQISRWAENQGK